MERIRFYGEIEEIPAHPTWEDVQLRARTNPALRQAVIAVERGMSREEALIRVALFAANEMVRNHDQAVDVLNRTIPNYFVIPTPPPDPEYK